MNWNAFTRAWYLIGQHAHVDLRAAITCSCRICHQHYDSYETIMGSAAMQAHDMCAWAVNTDGRWVIHCGYGSDFDLMEFWYLRDFPTEKIDGICDWCIRRMLHDGVIMDSGKEATI